MDHALEMSWGLMMDLMEQVQGALVEWRVIIDDKEWKI